jgi:hypothetical protein
MHSAVHIYSILQYSIGTEEGIRMTDLQELMVNNAPDHKFQGYLFQIVVDPFQRMKTLSFFIHVR